VFNDEKADTRIIEKITTPEELSGIFNWAIIGYNRLITQMKLTEGKSAKETREIYLEMSDPVNAFYNEMIEEDSEAITIKNEIWRHYGEFCINKGFITLAENKFFSELKKRVYVQDTQITRNKARIRAWKGLRLKLDIKNLLDYAQDTQDTQDVYTQLKIEKIGDIEKPVQPLQGVQLSLEEKLKKLASIFNGSLASTDYLVSESGWPEEEVRKLLGSMVRDGVVFRVSGESDVWRWNHG
jgi:phage/plasmid-associated DNA primase